MILSIQAETAPLSLTSDGVVQIGETRVTLDTVVAVFKQGATAEEIAYRYPSLKLGEVYASISYYLSHTEEVEAYLDQRQQQAQEIRQINQSRFSSERLRNRLLSRRAEQ